MESASPEHGLIVQKKFDEAESVTDQFRAQDSLHTPSTLTYECLAGARTPSGAYKALSTNSHKNCHISRGQASTEEAEPKSTQSAKEKNDRRSNQKRKSTLPI